MATLSELNPLDAAAGGDVDGGDGVPLSDPTTWDVNNLLGRYHIWKIASKFPIPGSAVVYDHKRRAGGPTAAELEERALAVRKEFEKKEEAKK